MSDAVIDHATKSGFKSSEFCVLFFAHALVLLCPIVGYPIDPSYVTILLALDGGYVGLRGGQKITGVVKAAGPAPSTPVPAGAPQS